MNAEERPPDHPEERAEYEPTPAPQASARPEMTGPGFASDDEGIGVRVTAVFTAAEKAGQHIVSLAREEAEDIKREARAEAEAYLREQKLRADQDVEGIFAEARQKADAIEAEARLRAQQVEDDARVRRERLREEARLVEERIAWVKDGLVEVSNRIDQVFLGSEPFATRSDTDG